MARKIAGNRYGYARASTEHQDPEMIGQRTRLLSAGVKPDSIREDYAVSGMKASRPGLDKLLSEVGQGDSITVTELSRLGRDVQNILTLVEGLDKHGVALIILNLGGQAVDTSSAMGRFFITILAVIARLERDITGERIQGTLAAKARKGEFTGGPRRFGFEPDGVTIREEEAEWIRWAADKILEGWTLTAVCDVLNSEGILQDRQRKSGNGWLANNLRMTLSLPRMAGLAAYKGEVTGPAPWPAIIPEDKWRELRQVLAGDKRWFGGRRTGGPGPKPQYLGSLLYRCGECKKLGRDEFLRGGKAQYYCNQKHPEPHAGGRAEGAFIIQRARIDAAVESAVVAELDKRAARRLQARPKRRASSKLALLDAEEEKLRRKQEDVNAYLAMDDDYVMAQWEEVTTGIRQRLDEIASQRRHLRKDEEDPPTSAEFRNYPLGRKRAIIREMCDVVIYRPRWRPCNGRAWDPDCVRIKIRA